jgi:DNA mismatch endonuclease (patch repair protein)
MSSVRNRDTELEVLVRSRLHRLGLRFKKHVRALPGTPDVVFTRVKVAVFIDGDFWHGYRFAGWRLTVSEFWRTKIAKNRRRDAKNFRALRQMGWVVIRVWGHELRQNVDACVDRISSVVQRRKANLECRALQRRGTSLT